MLKSDPEIYAESDIYKVIFDNWKPADELAEGIFEIYHFGGTSFLQGYLHYPTLSIGAYGVCDSVQQILDQAPELQDPQREFIITVTRLKKADQPSSGGWRWHKWGEYIGTQTPTAEYLFAEPLIEEVLVYHIYEKVKGKLSRNTKQLLLDDLKAAIEDLQIDINAPATSEELKQQSRWRVAEFQQAIREIERIEEITPW